jgi:hypothetical protein
MTGVPSRSLGPRWTGVAMLAGLAVVGWFSLGMSRGVLLSVDVLSRCWPWAPFQTQAQLQTPALSDPVWQFVPWLELARKELISGHLPLWNPYQDAGCPLLGNGQSAIASPLVWPVLLVGARGGWNASLLLRVLLAGWGMYRLTRAMGRSRAASRVAAVMFALSGPMVAWLEHPQSMVASCSPLLLLALHRVLRAASPRAVAWLAFGTFLVIAGGHVETSLMVALLAAACLACWRPTLRSAAAAGAGAVTGALLASPLWLPLLEYLRLSAAVEGTGRAAFVLPLAGLWRFVVPRAAVGSPIEGAITVSVTGLVLALAGAIGALRRREPRLWTAVVIVGLLASVQGPLARLLASHTPVYWSRLVLMVALGLAVLAAAGFDRLQSWAAARWDRRRVRAVAALAPLLVAAELGAAATGVHGAAAGDVLYPMTPVLERLREDHTVYRVLPLHTFLPPNSGTVYELEDVRGYDALGPRAWRATREAMGRFGPAPTVSDVLEPWDLARGGEALDFWNVKYILVHPQLHYDAARFQRELSLDLEQVYSGPDGVLLRNRRVMPRARLTGPGRVELVARAATRWSWDVKAERDSRMEVANPYFPGWVAHLDGRQVRVEASIGGATRVVVPAGRHRVELVYRPVSFFVGLAVAVVAATVLALLVWKGWPGRE